MATQKEMREIREEVITIVENLNIEGYVLEGIITDGVLFLHEGLDTHVVLKPIVKKEGFDFEDALQEYQDRQAAKLEREKERLIKAQERAEKAAAKLAEQEEEK